MSKPFDATTKELLAADPRGWAELLLGREVRAARLLNVDLSSITTEADSIIEVSEAEPWLVHVEFQSGYDPTLPRRLQRYNILVNHRYEQPVQSMALLLCREADGPAISGLFQQRLPDGYLYSEFRYGVVRVWELPAEQILAGDLSILPLAPLAKIRPDQLPGVIEAIHNRLSEEGGESRSDVLWMATYLLMGLRYPVNLVEQVLKGVRDMTESVTYQKLMSEGLAKGLAEGRAKGRAEEARRILKRQGSKRFGKPEAHFEAAIDSIADLDRLELLSERLLDVASWEEWLDEPTIASG